MWYDQMHETGVNHNKAINTAQLDDNLLNIMGLKQKTAQPRSYWFDADYHFQPEANWPYWKNNS